MITNNNHLAGWLTDDSNNDNYDNIYINKWRYMIFAPLAGRQMIRCVNEETNYGMSYCTSRIRVK